MDWLDDNKLDRPKRNSKCDEGKSERDTGKITELKLTFRGGQHVDKVIGKDAHFAPDLAPPPSLVRQLGADQCDDIAHFQFQLIIVLGGIGELHPAEFPLWLWGQHGNPSAGCCRSDN